MPHEVPHLENPDVQPETDREADRLRAAAVRETELKPTLERVKSAHGLLLQLRGFIAGKKLDLPIEIEQELTAWLHEDVMARKELIS